MKRVLVLLTMLATVSGLVACGGGGSTGEEPPGGSDGIPTPTGEAVNAELLLITATEWEFDPPVFEFTAGKTYKLQMLNQGEHSFRLNIPRWNILLFAQAGQDSLVSAPFTVEQDDNGTECYERLQGAKRGMYCSVTVVP